MIPKQFFLLNIAAFIFSFSLINSQVHHTVLKQKNTKLDELRNEVHKRIKLNEINEGTLVRKLEEGKGYELLPNLNTVININIEGMVSTTTVDQVFANDSDYPIEAVYVFPLSPSAAVNDMKMIVNDRFIKGEIQEKKEARANYERAKEEGKRASITEQNRPNMFTNTVSNIMPGDTIVVRLQFVDRLNYEKGNFKIRFPLVVAPRYIPGREIVGYSGNGWSFDTDKVDDASKITPPVLSEGMRSGNGLSINISLNPGLDISNIHSASHEITINGDQEGSYVINLSNKDEIPNRDFILEYTAANSSDPKAALITSNMNGEDYFMLMAVPPIEVKSKDVIPRNITFVIDVSGSMDGESIIQAKSGFEFALEKLNPEDSFNIIPFSNNFNLFSNSPISATEDNIKSGRDYVQNLEADGGTEALGALIAAMEMEREDFLNLIIFLTDGSVGDEDRILSTVKRHLGRSRLFSVGIGHAPNSYLLEKISKHGKGSFTYISSPLDVNKKMGNLISKIDSPVITDLKLNMISKSDLFPNPLPDLFLNEPVIVFGKVDGNINEVAILSGRVNNKIVSLDIPILKIDGKENSAIPFLWAREKINNLSMRYMLGDKEAKPEIIDLAIKYNLMSQFTSFVAIEHKIVNPQKNLISSIFPVDLVKGMNFDKIFSSNRSVQLVELPKTATDYPLYFLMGLLCILLSMSIRFRLSYAKN